MKVPKILHIGLCAGKNDGVKKYSSISHAFIDHCSEGYAELSSGHKNLNRVMIEQAEKMKPDIIFFQIQAPDIIHRAALEELRKHCKFIVNWTGDVRQPTPKWYLDLADLFDITFFTNEVDVQVLRNSGFNSEYLEIGYDPDIYYPDNEDRPIDVVFMANNYGGYPLSGYRLEAAESLRNHFGARFRLYGGGWNNADGNLNSSQYREADILRRCKIAINISHFDFGRYSSDRRLRILGCGCLCLSHNHKGIREDFRPGNNIVTFDSIKQMIQEADSLLADSKSLKQIASAGNQKAKSEFTFHRMIDKLLEFHKNYKR